MSYIPTPATVDTAPEASQPLLHAVKESLGAVPNLFRLVSNSPATLQGLLQLQTSLNEGQLDPATR